MNILILSPHTDDAELGCGGSLTKWMKHNLRIITFSACEKSIPKGYEFNVTKEEYYKSMSMLNADGRLYDIPVRNFPEYRQRVLQLMINSKKDFVPDLVVCPSVGDIHQDHKVVAEEAIRAYRDTSTIIGYEGTYNLTSFNPVYYVRLTKEEINGKIKLIRNYKSQISKNQDYFSEEYIYGLAKMRGIQVKSEYAEAFECYRFVS